MTMPIQFSDGPNSPCAPPMESMNENSAAPCIFHRLIPPWRFPVCGKYADLISAELSRRRDEPRVGVVALNNFCFADGRTNSSRGGAAQSSRVSRFMREARFRLFAMQRRDFSRRGLSPRNGTTFDENSLFRRNERGISARGEDFHRIPQ
jgi:hypothetical protein